MYRKLPCLLTLFLGTVAIGGACTPTLSPGVIDANGNDNSDNDVPAPSGNDNSSMEPAEPQASPDALPDFSLPDVNPQSPRSGESVSPRDYLGQVSAWYFGHST